MTWSGSVSALSQAVSALSGEQLVARLQGDVNLLLQGLAALDAAGPEHIAFLANPRYRRQAQESRAGALIITEKAWQELFPQGRDHGVAVICSDPYAWSAFAAQVFEGQPEWQPGIHPSAVVHPSAQVHASARVDAQAVIEAHAVVHAGAWIGAACVLGPHSIVGAHTRLHPRVTLAHGCCLGERGIVHSGAVIGADGFGFAPFKGQWIKIPQTGIVEIGDDVEIGANTTIDRGSAGNTVIASGVKIDNQVQIAHNCRVGAHTVIAGCVGIAGSAVIGAGCQLGGASMIHGHLSIADGTLVGAATLVSRSITEPGFYTGAFPLMKNRDWEKNAAMVRHLVEFRDRVRQLERQVGAGHTDSALPTPGDDPVA